MRVLVTDSGLPMILATASTGMFVKRFRVGIFFILPTNQSYDLDPKAVQVVEVETTVGKQYKTLKSILVLFI